MGPREVELPREDYQPREVELLREDHQPREVELPREDHQPREVELPREDHLPCKGEFTPAGGPLLENDSISNNGTSTSLPIFSDVDGCKLFKEGDVVTVCSDGHLYGKRGTIVKAGGQFNVQEGDTTTTFESLCSVKLDVDPFGFTARPIAQADLERYDVEPRRSLR